MPGRRWEIAQCSSMAGAEAGGKVGGGRPWPVAGCRARLYHEGGGDTGGYKAGKARRGNRVTTLACEGGLGGVMSQLNSKA